MSDYAVVDLSLVRGLVAVVVFGLALQVRVTDLVGVAVRPWSLVTAMTTQFVALPGLAVVACHLLEVRGDVALGLLLIACFPPGLLVGLLGRLPAEDAEVLGTLRTVTRITGAIALPAVIGFWVVQYPPAQQTLELAVSAPAAFANSVGMLSVVPFLAGLWVARLLPRLADAVRWPVRAGVLLAVLAILSTFAPLATVVALVLAWAAWDLAGGVLVPACWRRGASHCPGLRLGVLREG